MKARDITPGDTLTGKNGQHHYVVIKVRHARNQVIATVAYPDGGLEDRVWEDWQDVPLQHHNPSTS